MYFKKGLSNMNSRKTRLLCGILTLAMILTIMMIPSNIEIVKAETKGSYFGYDTYVDFLESTGLNTGASKKLVSDVSQIVSGTTENGGFAYFTYAELATNMGFVIPTDCNEILMDEGGMAYVGYKADGSKVVIVKTDGYNFFGYDVEGYDRNGYDVNGYDKNGYNKSGYDKEGYDKNGYGKNFTIKSVCFKNAVEKDKYKIIIRDEGQFDIEYLIDETGKKIDYYTACKKYNLNVSKKKISVKNGFGTYKVTISYKAFGKTKKWSHEVIVIPTSSATKGYYCVNPNSKGNTRNINILSGKSILGSKKKVDGTQYVVANDKNFKDVIAKETLTKEVGGWLRGKTITVWEKPVYMKERTFVKIGNKKYYSQWRVFKIQPFAKENNRLIQLK